MGDVILPMIVLRRLDAVLEDGKQGVLEMKELIASAILDRILHHATTISIRGDSYRLKDKLKSGVVKPTMAGT